ncbi:hypothetical protein ACSMXN_11695 [Jatrophihabitans sp. DSM 45814]
MVEISRRTLFGRSALLVAAAGGVALGVTKTVHHKVAIPPPPPPAVLTSLLGTQTRLLASYDAAMAAAGQTPVPLAPLRADVAAHGDALRGVLQNYPGWRLNPTEPIASPTAAPAAPTIAGLASMSGSAAAAFSAACLGWPHTEVNAGQTVGLLGSISACLSTHREVLA